MFTRCQVVIFKYITIFHNKICAHWSHITWLYYIEPSYVASTHRHTTRDELTITCRDGSGTPWYATVAWLQAHKRVRRPNESIARITGKNSLGSICKDRLWVCDHSILNTERITGHCKGYSCIIIYQSDILI